MALSSIKTWCFSVWGGGVPLYGGFFLGGGERGDGMGMGM